VVDDSPSDCELIRIAFAMVEMPAEVECVHDGREAINWLQQSMMKGRLPELVLLDLNMPRIDGFEVLVLLGEMSLLDRLQVVVLTTSNQPADRAHCMTLGARAFFSKPHDLDGMRRLVRDLTPFLSHSGT